MKPINSPVRTMALLGLSVAVHGATFCAFNERISLGQMIQSFQSTLPPTTKIESSTAALSEEITDKDTKKETKKEPVGFEFKKVESVVSASKKLEEPQKSDQKISQESQEKPQNKESLNPAKITRVKVSSKKDPNSIGSSMPEKASVQKTSETKPKIPDNKVVVQMQPNPAQEEASKVVMVPVSERLDGVMAEETEMDDNQTEAQVEVTKSPQELAELEALDLISEVEQSEPMRSYLGLKQASGNKPPTYPMEAKQNGYQGRVILNYFVNNEGGVQDIQVAESSGYKILDTEAVRAISGYRYQPGQTGWTEHPIKFTLNKTASEDLEASRR